MLSADDKSSLLVFSRGLGTSELYNFIFQEAAVIDGSAEVTLETIQTPTLLNKYYGLAINEHEGRVQFHPAERIHSPGHLRLN